MILTFGGVHTHDIAFLTAEQKMPCLSEVPDECTDIRIDLGTDQNRQQETEVVRGCKGYFMSFLKIWTMDFSSFLF